MNSATQQSVLRLGKIDFLNTLPFFYSADTDDAQRDIAFMNGTPCEINEKMLRQEVDMGFTSSFFYALHPEDFLILPGYCIGASGRAGSVTLYSREPIENLDGKTIGLSSKSLSAATLLKVYLARRCGFLNQFEISALEPEQMLNRYEACLLIGDEALFFRPANARIYDLSECWLEWTKTPFCFAVWTVRKDFFEQHPSLVRGVHEWLCRNLDRNRANPAEMVSAYQWPAAQKILVAQYLKSLEYRLTPALEQGLKLFFQYAADCGLAKRNVNLNFCEF